MCDEKWVLPQPVMTRLSIWSQEEAPKHFPMTYQKQMTLDTGALCWSWSTRFRIMAEPISEKCAQQIDECTENCYATPVLWSAKQVVLTTPNHILPSGFKVEQIVLSSASFTIVTWPEPTTTSSSILTAFCQENTAHNQQEVKISFKSPTRSEGWIFILRIKKLISIGNVVMCGSILINKDDWA